MKIESKLMEIQTKLNAPKNRRNSFGNYNYRSCEDILEAVKPLLKEQKCALTISDEIVYIGDRFYVMARATLKDCQSDESVTATAYAREADGKKGMDEAQVTGSCSSYARKYALNGLFCIDDNKDPDTDENRTEREGRKKAEAEVASASAAAQKGISQVKAKALISRCQALNINVERLLQQYGVEKAVDLTEEQHMDIHMKLTRAEEKRAKEAIA